MPHHQWVKCLPPENKPEASEIRQCNRYLAHEISAFAEGGGSALLALGAVAHQAVLIALGLKAGVPCLPSWRCSSLAGDFGPDDSKRNELMLYDSYHCSRYNTQTRRLTTEMFEEVFAKIRSDLA